ncbi:MAG: helix-turn-helix transcriptional regulator [Clostridia bacterium]|nr:helix-turn-helix transcriptional regulator [Clostridia bacterium]
MITSVGRFLRKLRIDRGEILRDMANRLGVSSAFLSAVENGKKKVPDTWISKLGKYYSLSAAQIEELKTAIIESSDTVELNIRNASPANRQLAVSFARQFDELDEETAQKLFDILHRNEEEQ